MVKKLFDIFKTLKENRMLRKENEVLKIKYDTLSDFKKNFDTYYRELTGFKVITREHNDVLRMKSTCVIDKSNIHIPINILKQELATNLCDQLLPIISFDILDNKARGAKELVGMLSVIKER